MADQKVSALTELTTFSGDETLYVVEDDDGTPASRRVTVENLATGLAARTEFSTVYAPLVSELSYVERTSSLNPTQTAEASAETIVTAGALSLDGSTRVKVEFYCPFARPANTAAATINFWLFDGSTSLGRIAIIGTAANNTAYSAVDVGRYLTPSNASHTFSIRVTVSTGTGLVSAGAGGTGDDMPAYIRVSRAPQ